MILDIKKNTPVEPFRKHWQFCVGSPHAVYALRRDYTEQLRQVHEELGIDRVRFHGIFCDDMHTLHNADDLFSMPGGRNYTEQSFRWCGAAYDNVLAAGMKPFVELGFMPRHLAAKNRRGSFFYKPVISPPKSHDAWYAYIQDFIRFLFQRYGQDEVSTWYFEVWNEPDLRAPFFAGSQQDYFDLYGTTAKAVKAMDSRLQVGGPATSGSKWIPDFVAYCEKNGLPADFVSTHQYAGDPIEGIREEGEKPKDAPSFPIRKMTGIRDRKRLPHDSILPLFRSYFNTENIHLGLNRDSFTHAAAKVRRQAQGKPVLYTEWNMCASFSAPCNDTAMAAAYDIHAILNTQGSVDGSSLWCFTDLFEESHPFPEEFHGGYGLLTQSGIKKPAYHALEMLGKAGEYRYCLPQLPEEIDAAAFPEENGIRLVLSRLAFVPEGGRKEITVRIETERAPQSLVLRRIDSERGNPLALWRQMGSPAVPTPAQVPELQTASAPEDEAFPFRYENGTAEFTCQLGENELFFFHVQFAPDGTKTV